MSNTSLNEEQSIPKILLIFLTSFFALFAFLIFYFLFKIWPSETGQLPQLCIFKKSILLTQEQQYFLLVVLGGALGSVLHIIISYTAFIGNNTFKKSWVTWYLLRPFIGSGLALVFYMLLRGGVLSYTANTSPVEVNAATAKTEITDTNKVNKKTISDSIVMLFTKKIITFQSSKDSLTKADSLINIAINNQNNISKQQISEPSKKSPSIPLNPFGIIAIACLAGLFSKNATAKLEEVFKTIFNVKEDNATAYKDGLSKDEPKTEVNQGKKDSDDEINDVLHDADIDKTDSSTDNQPQG